MVHRATTATIALLHRGLELPQLSFMLIPTLQVLLQKRVFILANLLGLLLLPLLANSMGLLSMKLRKRNVLLDSQSFSFHCSKSVLNSSVLSS